MKLGKEYWSIDRQGTRHKHVWYGSILDCQRYLEGNVLSTINSIPLSNGDWFDNILLVIKKLPHSTSGISFASKSLLFPDEDYVVCGENGLTAIQQVNNYLFKEADEAMENCNHEKVYNTQILLMSFPPMQQWICRKCGAEGVDAAVAPENFVNEYAILKEKFKANN